MKYIDLYCPLNAEHLWDFIAAVLDEKNEKYSARKETKKEVLKIIAKQLKFKLLYAGNNWRNQSAIERWDLTNDEVMKKIDEIWFENAKYPDFFNMVWFRYEDWYKNKIEELGMTQTTNWKDFVKNKIGDLEQWIEDNKPKD